MAHFGKILSKKKRFFLARTPPQINCILAANATLEKFRLNQTKIDISKKYKGRQGDHGYNPKY